jgi:hypothetical protein
MENYKEMCLQIYPEALCMTTIHNFTNLHEIRTYYWIIINSKYISDSVMSEESAWKSAWNIINDLYIDIMVR